MLPIAARPFPIVTAITAVVAVAIAAAARRFGATGPAFALAAAVLPHFIHDAPGRFAEARFEPLRFRCRRRRQSLPRGLGIFQCLAGGAPLRVFAVASAHRVARER